MEEREKVQMRATKLFKKISNYSYEERPKQLGLPILKYRTAREDNNKVYKLVHGIYDRSIIIALDFSAIIQRRGNISIRTALRDVNVNYDRPMPK